MGGYARAVTQLHIGVLRSWYRACFGGNRPDSSTILYRGVAQLVARLLWEREAQVRAVALGKPRKSWDSWADSTFPVAGNWSKIGVDHMFDHNWKIS